MPTMERTVTVRTPAPERHRMSHIVRDGARRGGTVFPAEALCGFVCTRWADPGMPRCGECDAIAARGGW